MKFATMAVRVEQRNYSKAVTRYSIGLASFLVVLFLTFGAIRGHKRNGAILLLPKMAPLFLIEI
jgi:hypothetical protein